MLGTHLTRTATLGVLVALCLPTPATPQAGQVDLTLGALRTRSLSHYGGHEKETLHEREAQFSLGEQAYGISYKAGYNDEFPDRAFPLEGYIGMHAPTSCNWYHSGFLFVSVNGKDIGTAPLSSMTISETQTRGVLDLVWHHPVADVRVRFLGEPKEDHLKCEIAIEPKEQVQSVGITLRCYPSFFTSHHKRVGARRITTPSSLISEGERKTVPAAENWWAVYTDDVFDVAKGEGAGPCAMMLLPGQAQTIDFAPGGYAVDTRIQYPPETRAMRMAFWEFPGVANAAALDSIRSRADSLRASLEQADFVPSAVRGVDAAAMRAEIQRAMAVPEVQAALADRVALVEEWLRSWDAAPTGGIPGEVSIAAQEELLKSVDMYYQFVWEVRLTELLSGL